MNYSIRSRPSITIERLADLCFEIWMTLSLRGNIESDPVEALGDKIWVFKGEIFIKKGEITHCIDTNYLEEVSRGILTSIVKLGLRAKIISLD